MDGRCQIRVTNSYIEQSLPLAAGASSFFRGLAESISMREVPLG